MYISTGGYFTDTFIINGVLEMIQDLQPYINMLPQILTVLVVAFLLTPLIGKFASRFGFIDLPKNLRSRTDKSVATRIHKTVKIRLGGLAVIIPLLFIAFQLINTDTKIIGIVLGILILTIGGLIDDKYELSARNQMIVQFLAATVVVLFGVSIKAIDIVGMHFDFSTYTQAINLGQFTYNMSLPGDIITIFWILSIINAINWMSGIDAIGELNTIVAAITTMLLSVKGGQMDAALLSGVLAAGVIGFVPYNWPQSKIMSGTAGTTSYGFLLAVLAIISGAKLSSSIMILSIPLMDMLWVMIYRFVKLKDEPFLKRPFIGGDVHLHHRLMALGLSQVQVLFVEISAVAIFSTLAVILSGFGEFLTYLVITASVLIVGFTIIGLLMKKKKSVIHHEDPPKPPMQTSEPTPEQKYAY